MHSYLLNVKGSLEGPQITAWHKITEDDKETKATLFGMLMSSKVNMAAGPLVVKSEVEMTAELMETHLRSLTPVAFKEFLQNSKP